jgi:hypothetical protein
MAASLAELRDALGSTLESYLPEFNVYRLPPDNVEPPAILVAGFQIDNGTFGDATLRVAADVELMVSRRHVDQVEALDELLSPSGERSVWELFTSDPTLGGAVGFCMVQTAGDYREMLVAEVGYYAATFRLSVML